MAYLVLYSKPNFTKSQFQMEWSSAFKFLTPSRPFLKKTSRYYQLTRQSYYLERNILNNLGNIEQLILSNSINYTRSNQPISLYGLSFGCSKSQAIRHLGKPNYSAKTSFGLKKHQIIFYRLVIYQVKCIMQLHFHCDQFFMGAIELRSQKKDFQRKVYDIVLNKYGISEEATNKRIVDEAANSIELTSKMSPYIIYRTGDQQVLDNIQFHTSRLAYKLQQKEEKELDFLFDIV